MRLIHKISVGLLICAAFLSSARGQSDFPPQQLLDSITPNGIRAHMEFLADDLLEGRETGTRGYQLAANYIRAQFEQMGLQPAGENGTFFSDDPFPQAHTPTGPRLFRDPSQLGRPQTRFRERFPDGRRCRPRGDFRRRRNSFCRVWRNCPRTAL
jgi:hypothetical protein